MPLGMRAPLANTRQAQYILLRQRAYLQQIVHQTTHSLARFFLEVDANYKQFKTASRLAGRRRPAARGPAGVLRGRPDHDRPLPRRRQPVRQRRRPGGPVQDHLQHLDRRAGGGQGDAARPTTTSPWPRARTRARPTSRPATSRTRTRSCRSRTTARCTIRPCRGPGESRPGRSAIPPPDIQPGDPAASAARPGRPARPAADPAAAVPPGGRAADPVSGRITCDAGRHSRGHDHGCGKAAEDRSRDAPGRGHESSRDLRRTTGPAAIRQSQDGGRAAGECSARGGSGTGTASGRTGFLG